MRIDRNGRPFYLDHNTAITTWTRPMPLPDEWGLGYDDKSRRYYFINHITGTLTWKRPVLSEMDGRDVILRGASPSPSSIASSPFRMPPVTEEEEDIAINNLASAPTSPTLNILS